MKNILALPVYLHPERNDETGTAYIDVKDILRILPNGRGCVLAFSGNFYCYPTLTSEEVYRLVCDSEEHPGKEDA